MDYKLSSSVNPEFIIKNSFPTIANFRNNTEAPNSILIVGATGLIGLKLIECVKRLITTEQTIYVLSRRHLSRQIPGVVVKVAGSDMWAQEISKVPNLTTVYSALGVRNYNHSVDEFYLVNHNLTYEVAIASKNAGASKFVFMSHYSVSFMIPRAFDRRTKMRNWIEKDLETLGFERLVIVRPGPLVGIRGKTGSLKGFSMRSIAHGIVTIALELLIFTNP